MGIEFHNTPMGRRFYESTLPQLTLEMSRIGGSLSEIHRLVATLVAERAVRRRTVLVAHEDVPLLHAVHRILGLQHEVHIARSHGVARELIELHEFDTLVVDEATAWERPGLSLFEQALVVRPEALCIVLGRRADHDQLRERRAVDVVLDDSDVRALLEDLQGYIR